MRLVVNGNGTVVVDGNVVTAKTAFRVNCSGDVCTITFPPDDAGGDTAYACTTTRNGRVTVTNMVNCGNGGRGAINVCTMGTTDILGFGPVNLVNSGTIIVNGRRVDGQRRHAAEADVRDLVTCHALDTPVDRVQLQSGEVLLRNQPTVSVVHVTGSGTVQIAQTRLAHLTAYVDGSGRIRFTDSHVDQLSAKVQGSGSIDGFVVAQRVDATVSGSGRITGMVEKQASVTQAVIGSGRTHLTTC